MKKLVPALRAGTQTVFISALRFVKKRLQHPVKASLGFIISSCDQNIILAITLNQAARNRIKTNGQGHNRS